MHQDVEGKILPFLVVLDAKVNQGSWPKTSAISTESQQYYFIPQTWENILYSLTTSLLKRFWCLQYFLKIVLCGKVCNKILYTVNGYYVSVKLCNHLVWIAQWADWVPGCRARGQLFKVPLILLGEGLVCVGLDQLHSPRTSQKEWNYKPLLSTQYFKKSRRTRHNSESTWQHAFIN